MVRAQEDKAARLQAELIRRGAIEPILLTQLPPVTRLLFRTQNNREYSLNQIKRLRNNIT